MSPKDRTDHDDVLAVVLKRLSSAADTIRPVQFLQPIWKIAGDPPLPALCDYLIEQRYSNSDLLNLQSALRHVFPYILESQSIGLGLADGYVAWYYKNMRITWPSYQTRNTMKTDEHLAMQIILSSVFKDGGFIVEQSDPDSGDVNLAMRSNQKIVFVFPEDEPMTLWLRTTFAYDKYIRNLTTCMIRALLTTYPDLVFKCEHEAPNAMVNTCYTRMIQLCDTINPAWARMRDKVHPAPPKGKSNAVKALNYRDEVAISQALDQVILIGNTKLSPLMPLFEHYE